MTVGSKMSVCLSVCLLSAKFFFTKTRENVYLRILILKFRGQDPRPGTKSTQGKKYPAKK